MQPPTTIEEAGNAWVVTLRGEVDAYSAPSLREDLRVLVEERGALVVVIDLSAVTFLDSSGLGAIVGVLRRLRERGGRLTIVEPESPASRIFEHTGLDAVLELYDRLDEAVSAATG
jgi:anti-sigma B factor antagonist